MSHLFDLKHDYHRYAIATGMSYGRYLTHNPGALLTQIDPMRGNLAAKITNKGDCFLARTSEMFDLGLLASKALREDPRPATQTAWHGLTMSIRFRTTWFALPRSLSLGACVQRWIAIICILTVGRIRSCSGKKICTVIRRSPAIIRVDYGACSL